MTSDIGKWQREEKEKEFKSISRCKANCVYQVIGCGFSKAWLWVGFQTKELKGLSVKEARDGEVECTIGRMRLWRKWKLEKNQESKCKDYPKEPVEKFLNKSVIQAEKKEQVKWEKQVIECFSPLIYT